METHLEENIYPQMPWMIDYAYISKKAPPKKIFIPQSSLDHLCNLSTEQKTLNTHITTIICYIDKDNSSVELIGKIIEAGISALCIDISKGNLSENIKLFDNIQNALVNYNKSHQIVTSIPIILELKGFRIRTGHLKTFTDKEPILNIGDVVFLTVKDEYKVHCDCNMIYVNYREIMNAVYPNDLIYINYGQIILQVLFVDHKREKIRCLVVSGGALVNEACIHLPNAPILIPEEKEHELIQFGTNFSIDCFFISHTRNAYQIENIKNILRELNKNEILLFAKIEELQGVENIDEILEVSDGIVVSRDELSIVFPPEKLFLIQKTIIAKCNKAGKPVVVSAHFLQSMTSHPTPLNTEIVDVANTITDGADCLKISEEVVKGNYTMEYISLMKSICREAEASIHYSSLHRTLQQQVNPPVKGAYTIAMSAVETAVKCKAACIIVITKTGRSAKLIAMQKPYCPVIAVTRIGHIARKIRLWRAVMSLHYLGLPHDNWMKDIQNRFDYGIRYGKCINIIRAGDAVVLVNGSRNTYGFANTLKVVHASENNCRPVKL